MTEIWRSAATKLGEELAKERGITALPVNPIAVAEQLNIVVEPLPPHKKGVSGMLVESNKNFGIMYATYIDNIGFQNFCVGHELGHYKLPGHYEQLLTAGVHQSLAGFVSNDRYELEADHFAAGLLMPRYLFDKALNTIHCGLDAVESLANTCNTSLTATAIRFAQRSPDLVAIIVSENQHVNYCFMSDELKELQGLSWIRKNTRLPQGTVTSRFNATRSNVLNSARDAGESSLLAWFGSTLDHEVFEEVIGLGTYGKSLTVLSVSGVPDPEDIDEENELMESWTPRFR